MPHSGSAARSVSSSQAAEAVAMATTRSVGKIRWQDGVQPSQLEAWRPTSSCSGREAPAAGPAGSPGPQRSSRGLVWPQQ